MPENEENAERAENPIKSAEKLLLRCRNQMEKCCRRVWPFLLPRELPGFGGSSASTASNKLTRNAENASGAEIQRKVPKSSFSDAEINGQSAASLAWPFLLPGGLASFGKPSGFTASNKLTMCRKCRKFMEKCRKAYSPMQKCKA